MSKILEEISQLVALRVHIRNMVDGTATSKNDIKALFPYIEKIDRKILEQISSEEFSGYLSAPANSSIDDISNEYAKQKKDKPYVRSGLVKLKE